MSERMPVGGDDRFGPLFLAETVHRLLLVSNSTLELDWTLEGDVEWSENVAAPTRAEDFAREAVYIICNSGMKHTIARQIYRKVLPALQEGRPVRDVFGHPGKAEAMETIWRDRVALFERFLQADDKLAFCCSLPWIGGITQYHLAKNLGVDCAKPDVHLVRLAAHAGETVHDLCERLAKASGWRVATVDLILWRACAVGVLSSTTGEFVERRRVAYPTFEAGAARFLERRPAAEATW